ncbi:uncharacterized protein LOC6537623 [Drosophila yakuba]|uniref:Uncharacterized protein n=1 Tax=Drosophila yakuba TaxID=7245 RepID=B4PKT1_DROYA|nr:uncharacterized protein LOC6537623 [Drosophila yakuba]EDW97880.1 uncharacterized protein Dyak_GE10225 [Drosophila yakuba]
MDTEIVYDQFILADNDDELLLIYDDEVNLDEEHLLIYEDVWKSEEVMTLDGNLANIEDYAVLLEVMDTPTIHFASGSDEEMTPEENLGDFVSADALVTSTTDVADLEELTVYIPEEITFADTGFFAEQDDNLEAYDFTYTVIASESFSHSPGELTEVTELIRYLSQDLLFQAYSPPSIPSLHTEHCPRHDKNSQNVFWSDMEEVSCILLHSAAAYMEPPAYVDDATVSFIAKGLSLAKSFTTEEPDSLSARQSIGRLVAAIVMDRESGVVMAYAVIHLVPQVMSDDSTGELLGMMLHNVIRGFAINEHFRRIIIENSRHFLLVANQIPN